MKKSIFLLILCLLSISLQAQQSPAFQDTIPFRNDLGIITIPIIFNGVEKQFAFDTGAQSTVGFSWVENDLKHTSKKVKIASSSGDIIPSRYYKSGVIHLGSRKIKKHRILKLEDSDIFSCYNIDGILGVDITKKFNWTIDFEKKILIMFPVTFFPEEVKSMHELAFTFKNNRPHIYMDFNINKIRFLFDTGASDSDLNKNDYKLIGIDTIPKINYFSGSYDARGTFTKASSQLLQMPEMKSKNVSLFPIMDYKTSKSKIGNTLWKNKRLFMSLHHQKLYVSNSSIQEERSSFECGVRLEKGKMTVSTIHKNTEAWDLGIRQGDEIKTINGNVFTDFCELHKYQTQLIKEKKDIEFVFVNGKQLTIQRKQMFIIP